MKFAKKFVALILALLIVNSSVIALEAARRVSRSHKKSRLMSKTSWDANHWLRFISAFADGYGDSTFGTVNHSNSINNGYECSWTNISNAIAEKSGQVENGSNGTLDSHDKSIFRRAVNTWIVLKECRDLNFWRSIGEGLVTAGKWILHFLSGGLTYILTVVTTLYDAYKAWQSCTSLATQTDGREVPEDLGKCAGKIARTIVGLVSRKMRKKLRLGDKVRK